MANKLNVPNILGLSTGNTAPGTLIFLQSVQDALNVVDNNTVYKDSVRVTIPASTIRARTAQGQTFSVSGVNVASGDDYVALVQNFEALLQSHLKLLEAVDTLTEQLKGKQ